MHEALGPIPSKEKNKIKKNKLITPDSLSDGLLPCPSSDGPLIWGKQFSGSWGRLISESLPLSLLPEDSCHFSTFVPKSENITCGVALALVNCNPWSLGLCIHRSEDHSTNPDAWLFKYGEKQQCAKVPAHGDLHKENNKFLWWCILQPSLGMWGIGLVW